MKTICWLALCCLLSPLAALAQPQEVDWLDLLPASDLKALEEMPEIDHDGAELERRFDQAGGLKQLDNLPAVMYSRNTVAELDGREILLGGYLVPLELDAQGRSFEFFLVPYPGACIHVPPPPPNQIILVRYPKGVAIEDIYAPFWVTGTLKIDDVSNPLADAVYSLEAKRVELLSESLL